VHQDIAAEFEQRFVAGMEQLIVGDPMDQKTQVGPLATPAILRDLEDQVRRSVDKGAHILTGGAALIAPAFLRSHRAHRYRTRFPRIPRELFGPVASLFLCP